MSLEFILTYLKYVQQPFNSHNNLILIKKYWFDAQPALTQKFIQVKLKQGTSDHLIFINFLITFSTNSPSAAALFAGSCSSKRFRSRNFHKELSEPKLLTACLNCVKEWKALVESEKEWSDSIMIIVEKSECFETKFNLGLLSKYFPKFEQFSNSFPLITAYIRIFQQSLNLIDLEQIEMDLSLKLEAGQANFEMVMRNLGKLMPKLDLMARSLLALVDPSSDLMFYCGLLNANVDLDVYVDRVRSIEAMVGTVQSGDWRGKKYFLNFKILIIHSFLFTNKFTNYITDIAMYTQVFMTRDLEKWNGVTKNGFLIRTLI
ncbi:hypothetical protein BpHYR1_042499 [Brachionus plicatilis]|uniref:Uncharacterized protein n=1 Tax=Brachionus plicatilis TaxID=10195 RepID=A0A3M7SXN9_BRAPC|nr:hypothetical protein BpHYR1_042499 [Brachionus plicatilis]